MDYKKIKHIQTIGELEKLGEVNKENPGLAILTLKNGDQYYYFYNEQEGSVELIKELNSVGDSKTKTYMHTLTRKEGYAFTVDSGIDVDTLPSDEDITRTRYVVLPKHHKIIEVFQNNQPNPEPAGLLWHSYYNSKYMENVFVAPERLPDWRGYTLNHRETNKYNIHIAYSLNHEKPVYMIIIPKNGKDTSSIEILSTHELRQLHDTTDDKELKDIAERYMPYFLNKFMQDTSMANVTELQNLYDVNESVDKDSIPGMLICSSFAPRKLSEKFKSYFLVGKDSKLIPLGKDWCQWIYDSHKGDYCQLSKTDNKDILRFSISNIENSDRNTEHYYWGNVRTVSQKLVFLDTREDLEIGTGFYPIRKEGWQGFKSLTRFCLVDNKRNIHYGRIPSEYGKKQQEDVIKAECEDGLELYELNGKENTVMIAWKGNEPVYAANRGPYKGREREVVEFLTGEQLKKFIEEIGVEEFNSIFRGGSRGAKKYFDRVVRLFNPTFMEGEFVPKSPEEIEKIEKEVNVADLRRKLADQIEEAEKTKKELRALGVEPEGDAK